ncbi:hypothetical protein BT96DRAFT_1014585 [Gymnopus androsaceus JB14]|uniref:Uncharacterized protein n=1 Tax=Gymnopus androsaceus JB14 TaxID=1447944 RepID=A0A6A4IA59_9AGAR|nr:hypothetical protein BT96DRAFT_1014585 [Gymnopus androsaceus JB14]
MVTDGHEIKFKDGSHNTFGICVLDPSTSQFNLVVFKDDIRRTKLGPKEMLHQDSRSLNLPANSMKMEEGKKKEWIARSPDETGTETLRWEA